MMTLSKIAELAHVSVSTASKAFSGSKEVSEETKNQIFAVAKKHGCLKKFYKKEYYIPVVAVVCPEIDGIYSKALSCISRYLDRAGCKVSISTTHFSVQKKRQLMEFYSRFSVADGVIIIDYKGSPELPHTSIFPVDYKQALELAMDYFSDRGITDIAFVGWLDEKFSNGIESEKIIANRDASVAVEKLMKNLPRAVICSDDLLAMGVIKYLTDSGVKVPGQVAVMGMGDIPEAKYMSPTLSTVNFKLKENCKRAVDEILRQIDGEKAEKISMVSPELVIRKST